MSYSKALDLKYNYFPNLDQLVFEDGVCYTTEEAVIMAKMDAVDIRAVHNIKKIFGGNVLRESEGKSQEEQEKSWFELEPHQLDPDPSPLPVKKKTPQLDAEILTLDL